VFDAQLAAGVSEDPCRIYLDRTAFYPTSGGQPHDLGTLGGQPVIEVIDEGERIVHVTAAPVLASGNISGEIDWSRRYDHMQQHTGQHLLSAVFAERFGFQTLSFHMGSEVSTIELATAELSESQIDEAERQANVIASESRPVHIRFEEAAAVDGLRKPSERSGTLRIIEIDGLDRSACGGTHVRSSSETAPLQIRKAEKIRGNVRIEFVCGLRAVKRDTYRQTARTGRGVAAAFGCGGKGPAEAERGTRAARGRGTVRCNAGFGRWRPAGESARAVDR
jgi:alanyl-tRNA synthetase